MIVNSIDIESIVTMLKNSPKEVTSEHIEFARGSHQIINSWDNFIKRLK